MKKYLFVLLSLLSCFTFVSAQEDSAIFIHPGRETFVYFPSKSLKNAHTVTFFLPEKAVPLSRSYPVIVALGIVPKQAAEVAAFQTKYPSIVVGINFVESDYETKADDIVQFLSHEILPYVDTNYLTQTGPENRILAGYGKGAAKIALRVAQNPQLFGALALFSPGDVWQEVKQPLAVRTLVSASQAELALAQEVLHAQGKIFGPDFALRYFSGSAWLNGIDAAYLFAPAAEVTLKKLSAAVSKKDLPLDGTQHAALRVWAVLADNSVFNYIPLNLRVSPPYLNWTPTTGLLEVIPGAQKGTVRVRNLVDNPGFQLKIKLKKPSK